jgi:hypothetical protein
MEFQMTAGEDLDRKALGRADVCGETDADAVAGGLGDGDAQGDPLGHVVGDREVSARHPNLGLANADEDARVFGGVPQNLTAAGQQDKAICEDTVF